MPTKPWDGDVRARALEIAQTRPISEASAETGVPAGTIKRWRFEEKASGRTSPPPTRERSKVVPMRRRGSRQRTEPNRSVREGSGEPARPKPPADDLEIPRPPGRPPKLTVELQERILALIVRGDYVETAVALVGVGKTAFYEWLAKGRTQKRGRYVDFANAIEMARAQADHRDLGRVDKGADNGQWQASAWRLERRRPELYGRGGLGPLPEQPPAVNPEDYEAIASAVAGKILGLVEEISPDVAAQVRERLGHKPDATAAEPGVQAG